MITLMVEPYCQDCCYFEADVNTSEMFAENYCEFVNTTIRCKSQKRCADLIIRYIKGLTKGEETNDD